MYYDQTDLELGPGMVNSLRHRYVDRLCKCRILKNKKKWLQIAEKKSALNDSQFNVNK